MSKISTIAYIAVAAGLVATCAASVSLNKDLKKIQEKLDKRALEIEKLEENVLNYNEALKAKTLLEQGQQMVGKSLKAVK